MTLYRMVISPEAPVASKLQSDTLFGAFCWAWLRCFGQQSLEEDIITPSLCHEPPVIFSNVFPHDALPLPLGCYDKGTRFETITDKSERRKAYQRGKKLKNTRFVSLEAFERIRSGNWYGFSDSLVDDQGESNNTLHNMVSRESGTVENIDGAGGLFSLERRFFRRGQQLDCYVFSSLTEDVLKKVLALMLALGIGADKSSGCGVFRLEEFTSADRLAQIPADTNAVMMLSNFLPAKGNPTDGWYQILPKYSKLDRELASEEYPFKKPLLFIKAGSTFRVKSPDPWYGRCVTGITAVDVPVTVCGCAVALAIKIPE